MRHYSYRCHDYSLLTPGFKKWIVGPLLRFLPWSIPANMITIVANAFVYASLYIALNPEWFGPSGRLFIGLGLFLYLIGDHLDGMQAKQTGTGSALGEFCDHYLDAFNNGVIVYILFIIFNVNTVYFIGGVISASYLAHASIFYEQYKTGWLTFEKIGSLEAVLFASIIIGTSYFQPVYSMATMGIGPYSLIEWTMLASLMGSIGTLINAIKRTPQIKTNFWFFTVMLIAITAMGIQIFSAFQLFITITLYASLYVGKVMRGHLVDGRERNTDVFVPLMMILIVMDFAPFHYAFITLIVGIMLQIGYLIIVTFSSLRVYWVWINTRN